MEIYPSYRSAPRPAGGTVLTIGNFDGVHIGHRALIDRVCEVAAATGGTSTLLTFHPHPSRVLGRRLPPPLLTTQADRRRLLAGTGLARLIEQPFTLEWADLTPEAFAREILAEALGVRHVVLGHDFVFGRGRSGDEHTLRSLGAGLGFSVEAVAAVELDGLGTASSTRIRAAVSAGELEIAARLLGRPYHLHGHVVRGAQRGRLLGFPTANLHGDNELIPPAGVYAGYLDWGVGPAAAAISVGDNPTFGDTGFTVEAHVLTDAPAEPAALDLYGKECHLWFVQALRGQLRFSGPDALAALTARIARDVSEIGALLAGRPAPTPLLAGPGA